MRVFAGDDAELRGILGGVVHRLEQIKSAPALTMEAGGAWPRGLDGRGHG